ncbi:MAG: hypothetical protein C0600_13935 [Ignavibacteria bacterium]|nr:MAG: hypothetical protein C0600_13935 [Ignavibacteria bacterium]
MQSLALTVFILLLIVLQSAPLQADSWPRKKRTTYLRLGLRGLDTDSYYNAAGNKVGIQRLEEQTYRLYSEYGYSKYVTGIVNIPGYRKLVVQESAGAPTQVVEAPGDIELGLRVGIFASDHDVITLSGIFGIPIGETSNASGLWSGDDEYNQLVSVGYQHSFEPFPARIGAATGYNIRNSGYSDEIHVRGEIELRPLSFLQFFMRVHSVASQGNGDPTFLGGSYGYAANNRHFLMYGPEIAVWLSDGIGFNAGMQYVTSAKNVPSSIMFSTGVFFIFSSSRDR